MQKQFKYEFFIPIIAILLRLFPYPYGIFSYLIIAIYALLGPSQAIKALLLACFLSSLNMHVFPDVVTYASGPSSEGHYLVMFTVLLYCAFKIFFQRAFRLNAPIIITLSLGLFYIVHSILFSQIVDISLLKVAIWTLIMTSLIYLWSLLSFDEHNILSNEIFLWIGIVVFLSFPLIFMSQGFVRNHTDFQGLFNGSQVLGIVCAVLLSFHIGDVFSKKYPSLKVILFVFFLGYMMFISGSRTGIIALFFSVITYFILVPILIKNPIENHLRIMNNPLFYFFVITLFALASYFSLGDKVISKRSNSNTLIEAYLDSRSIVMAPTIENIKQDPIIGIGFGVGSDYENMSVARDPLFNLPYRASAEKGLIFLAVLEEVGIIGLTFFLLWLLYIFKIAIHNKANQILVLFAIVFLNFGESMILSSGGIGLLIMILLAWIMTSKPYKSHHND